MPTFQRIREKHPDAEMKWFARGKLWDSPEAARIRHDDGRGRRPFSEKRGEGNRDRRDAPGAKPHGRPDQEKRGRDWRPGGEHRDPRQKFVDAKKQQNAALRKERWERKNAPPRAKPHGEPPRPEVRRESHPGGRDNWRDRPRESPGAKPGNWRDRPHGDPRRPDIHRESRPTGRESWRDRPRENPVTKPGNWRDRPPADRGPKPERPSRDRPPRDARGPQGQADRNSRGPQGRSDWRPNRNPGLRGQATEDPRQPPRPRGPDREPRRSETPKPTPPPKPDEPKIPPPGPSERGHIKSRRPFRPRQGPPKGPRR
jgi:hypothetical protein